MGSQNPAKRRQGRIQRIPCYELLAIAIQFDAVAIYDPGFRPVHLERGRLWV